MSAFARYFINTLALVFEINNLFGEWPAYVIVNLIPYLSKVFMDFLSRGGVYLTYKWMNEQTR